MRLLLNEAFVNPQKKNAEDLAKTVLDWYDFDTNYIDDGGQRRAAETKNKNTVEWFDEHPIEIKQKAYAMMKSKVHSSDTGKLQREFEKHLKESVNEGNEYVTESNSLNEVNVTRIPNLNLESDAYITMLDLLKTNAKFKSIVSIQAEDLYSGGRPTNVFNILRGQLSKIMTPQIILSVIQKINSKRMILSVDTDDVNKGIHNDRFAGILALGIVDSLIGDPLDLKLIKDLGNAKVAKLAQEYSVNRGKQKFSSIIGNIKF